MSKYLSKEHLIETTLNDLNKIYKTANNALYFNDSSDYKSALWEIMSIINPLIDDYEELEYID